MSASRTLSLHPSALSDTEHALYTSTLAELLYDGSPSTSDSAQASISVREARAWIRGRYSTLGAGTVDEILRFFPPASNLGRGEFFAVLRLVLHAQEGHGVSRSLAFVQAPVPTPTLAPGSTNPFLPTPAPSPEAYSRPPLPPRKPKSPHFAAEISSSASSVSSASSSTPSLVDTRRSHKYSSSLSLSSSLNTPPALPLRRSTTHTRASSSTLSSVQPISVQPISLQRTASNPGVSRPIQNSLLNHSQNPFRPQHQALRESSTSEPVSIQTVHNPYSQATPHTAPPVPRRASSSSEPVSARPERSAFDTRYSEEPRATIPRTAPPTTRTFSTAVHAAHAPPLSGRPPVHPQRRASTESAPATFSPFSAPTAEPSGAGRRAASEASPSHATRARPAPAAHAPPSLSPLPIHLPKVVRRTLAGAGWVGAERGEREGLMWRASESRRRDAGGEGDEDEGEGGAWGAL